MLRIPNTRRGGATAKDDAQAARGRLALLYPYSWWETFQPLLDTVELLADDGWLVDVFVPAGQTVSPNFPARVRLIDGRSDVFPAAGIRPLGITSRHGGRLQNSFVTAVARPIKRRLRWARRWVEAYESGIAYSCFIGLDSEGLSAAAYLAAVCRRPYAFWSLEQSFMDECTSPVQRRNKLAEILSSRAAAFAVSQDPWRAEMLVQENGMDPAKVECVPVACKGNARSRPSDFMHREFGLQSDTRVVICPGHLAAWAQSKELASASRDLPPECVLVLHARQNLSEAGRAEWDTAIRDLSGGKALLSHRSLDRAQLVAMLDSASIGVALYDATRAGSRGVYWRNVEIMGYSSGKVSDFLQCSLPVVVSDTLGPRELVREWRCGQVVSAASGLGAAVARILESPDAYSERARRCFDDTLELERRLAPVLERLRHLGR